MINNHSNYKIDALLIRLVVRDKTEDRPQQSRYISSIKISRQAGYQLLINNKSSCHLSDTINNI